ncbi:MAG: pentapeptide repeat-containing protein, partial [Pseudomonadota bacterium]
MTVDDQLEHLKEIAQNARTTWFGLLAVLLFVGVTLMGHQDRDFFAFGAATTLPLVNIDVPPTSFFIAAPILTAALYCYLHVYLLSLWEALGRIPQEEGAEPLADRVYPMLFTIAGLWFRSARRGDGCMAPRVLGRWTIATALILGWGAGPFLVIALAWTAHAAHEPVTALLGALAVWASLAVGLVSLRAAWLYLSDEKAHLAPGGSPGQFTLSAAILIGAVLFSLARTQGGDPLTDRLLDRADLAEAEITVKPAVWLDYEDWVTEHTATFRKREGLGRDQAAWTPEDREVLKTELKKRWAHLTGSLDKLSLAGRDLRGANLAGAFLVGADFRCEEQPARKNQWEGAACARLDGATLVNARMEGADLIGARMEGAVLSGARMEGAVLSGERMGGADLSGGRMEVEV